MLPCRSRTPATARLPVARRASRLATDRRQSVGRPRGGRPGCQPRDGAAPGNRPFAGDGRFRRASACRRYSRARSGRPIRCFGVLSDLLGVINTRLESVRDSIERRHALAMATPSIWPVAGWLSSSFGTRKDPFSDGRDFHPGLDISADYGQPVLATGDARVMTAGMNGAYGNMVTLDHGYGITTKYGHLSRIVVSDGQQVKRGDLIGFVGSTGRSTGAHLHYEVWMNGRLTNP